jgi:DNA-binding transcriptional ArsR family regulator
VTVDQTFNALADPTRTALIARLAHGPASVSELAVPFEMSLRGVLKHVQLLEDAGLIRTVKAGRVRSCELRREQLEESAQWLERVARMWDRRLDQLEKYTTRKVNDDN